MNKLILTIEMTCAGIVCFADTKTTYRDASGLVTRTETTDRYGKTTYRDAQRRVQGTKK